MRSCLIILFALASAAYGQWDPDGIYIGNGSVSFSLCQDGSGGIYLGWEQGNPNYFDIYVQRVDSAGYKCFGEAGLNLTAGIGDNHGECHICPDGQGGIYAAYRENLPDSRYAKVQHVDSLGNLAWGEQGIFISDGIDYQGVKGIIQYNSTECVITYRKSSKNYVQYVNQYGEALWDRGGVLLSHYFAPYPFHEDTPYIITDSQNSVFAVWQDTRFWDYTSNDIYSQKVNMLGQLVWDSVGVPVVIYEDNQGELGSFIRAVPDGQGGIVVAWQDDRYYYPDLSVFTNRLNSSGQSMWNIEGLEVATLRSYELMPNIFQLENKFLYIWDTDNGSYGKLLNLIGSNLWSSNGRQLTYYPTGDVYYVQHSANEYSGIVWPNDFRAIKFDTLGTDIWEGGVHLFDWDMRYNLMADGAGGVYAIHSGYLQRVYPNGRLGGDTTSVDEGNKPNEYQLNLTNYPNPFNASTIIKFSVNETTPARLEVFDILGRKLATLLDRMAPPGNYEVRFDAGDYPSGVYYARLSITKGANIAHKLVLVK